MRLRSSTFRRPLLAILAISSTSLAPFSPASHAESTSPVRVTNSYAGALPGKQVWAHMVPHGLPDYVEGGNAGGYGDLFPLDLIAGNWSAPQRATAGLPRAQAAGLTGMQILQFDWINHGGDFVTEWMKSADPTWSDSNPTNDFSIAPCFFATTKEGALHLAREYKAAAEGHPSAARVGARLAVYVYGTRALSATDWAAVRGTLAAEGTALYWIDDLSTESSQHGFSVDTTRIDPYIPNANANWLFDDSSNALWPSLSTYLSSRKINFTGGIMPGYDRETSDLGGYVDPRGTKQLREQWEVSLTLPYPWVNIVTWNDMVERTDIKASSNWSITRQDINAFYSAKFRGIPYPKPSPQLYLTTPNYIRLGEPVRAESLVLNGGKADVTVKTQIVDSSGNVLGPTATSVIKAGTAGDATTAVSATINSFPPGRYVNVRSWLTDASGRITQWMTGAPVVIYDGATQATPMMRRNYYSVPASKVMPQNVKLSLSSSPTAGPATATVTVPTTTNVRFAQVLQNTRSAGLGFDTTTLSVSVPMKPTSIIGGQVVSSQAKGFYVARVFDDQERVRYSTPLWIG